MSDEALAREAIELHEPYSPERRAAFDRLLARLHAAEAVCEAGVCPSCGQRPRIQRRVMGDHEYTLGPCNNEYHDIREAWEATRDE
jgi:hypothetical protein